MATGEEPIAPKQSLLWFQFRLRTFLVAVLIVSSVLGLVFRERIRVANHRAALKAIGGVRGYSHSQPAWHRLLFGEDPRYFVYIFQGSPNCDDAALVHLEGLNNMTELMLSGTKITDSGLTHIRKMPKLSWLEIRNTEVTDAGLEHLKHVRIGYIDFTGTKVTKTGHLNYCLAHPGATVRPIPAH